MLTANQLYFDAALRRQVHLRRYSSHEMRRILDLFEKADQELVGMLRNRLPQFEGGTPDWTGRRWMALLQEIRKNRAAVMAEYKSTSRDNLVQVGKIEANAEQNILDNAIPIEVSFVSVALDQIHAIVKSQPFQGRVLRDWFRKLERGDQERLQQALMLGMSQGETTDQIVQRVAGTKANNFADGILSINRRDATTIIRTATNHVANAARNALWQNNDNFLTCRIWNSVLDGRTTNICIARDHHGSPIGNNPLPDGIPALSPPDARPPAHMNCRSIMVTYIDGTGLIGRRPTVTDTRTRRKREIDFRKMAKDRGVPIQQVRKEWAQTHVGGVPADTTYPEWLKRQPAAFQDDVLGPTRGALFRRGGMKVTQFVDHSGKTITLHQLAKTDPSAFMKAGLDPANF